MESVRQNSWAVNYGFVDILEERRFFSDLTWASKKWKPKLAWIQPQNISPAKLKLIVKKKRFIKHMITELSKNFLVPQNVLYTIVSNILDEAGFSTNLYVIRIFAFLLSKTFKKLLAGIFINEARFLQIKTSMGKNPVVFVPSHRSYFDFLTMAYIFFYYDVEIPKIAAGMDFQQMKIIGDLIRQTGALFIRRSFKEDKLYSKIFSTYVETLIEWGSSPVEFFIEGTRSRTAESLVPKLGFLTMVLKPFFFGKTPNITLIPVNLSYDRILEELLFAIELVGVPKPKESTMNLMKALSSLKESNYGNIYVNFGSPISIKQYFQTTVDRSIHGQGPSDSQELSSHEKEQINNLAHYIVVQQRELTTLNIFNLIALILNDNLLTSHESLSVNELLEKVQWIYSVIKILTPKSVVFAMTDISKEDILHHLKLHEPLTHLTVEERVQIGKVYTQSSELNLTQSKAHILSNDVVDVTIPLIMLQNYLNPCSIFFIHVCFLSLIVQSSTKKFLSKEELFNKFQFLCTLFYFKFVFYKDYTQMYFEDAISLSQSLQIIHVDKSHVKKGDDNQLHDFFYNFCFSYIPGYIMVTEILTDLYLGEEFSEKQIIKSYQEKIESEFKTKSPIHPANLCVNNVKNALQAFTSMKALQTQSKSGEITYKANEGEVKNIQAELKNLYPYRKMNLDFLQHFSNFTASSL